MPTVITGLGGVNATMHAFLNFCGTLSAGDHAIELIAAELAARFAALPG